MRKQLLRSLARSGRSALLEVLYNGTKMKRNISICSVLLQNVKGHTEGKQPISRAYSLAMAAQKTSNSEASKYIFINNCVVCFGLCLECRCSLNYVRRFSGVKIKNQNVKNSG